MRDALAKPEAVKTVEPGEFREIFAAVHQELARAVIGQDRAVEHLLVAIAAERGGQAAQILRQAGIDQEKVYSALARIRGSGPDGTVT